MFSALDDILKLFLLIQWTFGIYYPQVFQYKYDNRFDKKCFYLHFIIFSVIFYSDT